MAYHLKAKEPVSEGLQRIAAEELESAASQLEGKGEGDPHEAVHEARKSVKKVRAILRLIEPALGRRYRTQNRRLRDTGRKLSEIRDAGAIIETFESLEKKYEAAMGDHNLDSIRRALVQQKKKAERLARSQRVRAALAESLRSQIKAVGKWPAAGDGFGAIEEGLAETYRRGRSAFATARKHPLPENFHEWRKRVKDHWYHVRLMEHVWTDVMGAYEKSLKDLETWLGDDHNLVVLRDKIAGDPEIYGKREEIDFLLELTGKYQAELRQNALALGERIYGDKPRVFAVHMRQLWEAYAAGGQPMG